MSNDLILEYLSWSPTREIFVQTMCALINPITNTPLASISEETGELIPSEFVLIDEIGEIIESVWDEEAEEVVITKRVEGHHVNLAAYGPLKALLEANGGFTGIFPLLGDMEEVESEDGVPNSWVGSSGMRIFPATEINTRYRVWA